jgi:3-polyprenyl-4-hydroxybenzoate decarboxylase
VHADLRAAERDVSRGRRGQCAIHARAGGDRFHENPVWGIRQVGRSRRSHNTHGLGYAKIIIVVDADVDPFDLNQVMWAMSVKVNPAGDIMILPNLAENLLDPAGQPSGMAHRMIIDATTPIAPDIRGDFGQELEPPQGADVWRTKLSTLMKDLQK